MKQYKSKKGGMVNADDAQVVGIHLERLTKKAKGTLATEEVLKDAKNSTSPIHKYFDWNNSTAAEKYRLQQARQLMGSIMEVVVIGKEQKVTRSYYSIVDSSKKNKYVPVEIALTTKKYTHQIIAEAQEHIKRLNDTLTMFIKFN